MGWKGLALGNVKAWYGEIDMLICHNSNAGQYAVPVLFDGYSSLYYDSEDDKLLETHEECSAEEQSLQTCIAVEGERTVSPGWSLVG